MKKINKFLIALTLITGIVLLAIPSQSVFAQDDTPPNSPRKQQKDLSDVLEALTDKYDDMGDAIQNTDDVVRKIQGWIEQLESHDRDASGLQTSLDTFLTNMEAVQTTYDNVGDLLNVHAGFDADGNVTDEIQALATLRSIAEGLLDVHQLGEDARLALKWDLMTFRYLNQTEK